MINLEKIRLPYREDTVFGLLALAVFLVPLAFTMGTYEGFETAKLGLLLFFSGFSWLLFFLPTKQNKNSRISFGVLPALLGLFWLWNLGSLIFSVDRTFSLWGFYPRFTSGFLFLSGWVMFGFLALGTLTKDKWVWLGKIVILDSLLIAVYGIIQSMGFGIYVDVLDESAYFRAPSFLGNPNFSTMFMATVVPLAAAFFLKAKGLWNKLYYLLVIFFVSWSEVILASRGALLALVFGMVFFAVFLAWRRITGIKFIFLIFLLLAGFTAVLAVSRPNLLRPSSYSSEGDKNIADRFFVWDIAREGVQQNPLLGVGPGNFLVLFTENRGKNLSGASQLFDDAHNLFLQTAATAGLPAALALVTMIFYVAFFAFRYFKSQNDLLALAVFSGLIVFSVAAAFTPVSIGCWLLFIFLLSAWSWLDPKQRKIVLPDFSKILLLPAGLFIIYVGVTFFASEYLFFSGYQKFFMGDKPSALKRITVASRVCPLGINPFFKLYSLASEIEIRGNYSGMEEKIRNFSKDHPRYPTTYTRQANLFYTLYLVTKEERFVDETIEAMKQAIFMDPNLGSNYIRMALTMYSAEKKAESLEFVQYGLSLDKESISGWLLLAKLFQDENRKQPMLYALNQAFLLTPDNVQIKRLLEAAKSAQDIKSVPMQIMVQHGRLE